MLPLHPLTPWLAYFPNSISSHLSEGQGISLLGCRIAGAYAFSRCCAFACPVAPISCSQSLFVIVIAVVPCGRHLFLMASAWSDSAVSSSFFRLSHLAAASWVMLPIRLWPCHPKVRSFTFAACLLQFPRPSIIAQASIGILLFAKWN